MKTGLTVIAYVTAKAGQEDEVRNALVDLVARTNYDLHQSDATPLEFAIYENWKRASDLDAHAKSGHVRAFRRKMADRLERPSEITKWRMVSELGQHGEC